MERSSLVLQPFAPGQRLRVQTADGKEHDLTAIGISHEVGAAPAFYAGRVAGHVTPETLAGPRLRRDLRRAPHQGRRPDPRPGRHPRGRRRRLDAHPAGRDPRVRQLRPGPRSPPGQRPAPGLLPRARVHRRAVADRVRVPGDQHRVGDPRPADAADRDHEGDRRPQRPDRRAVPRAGVRLRRARAVRRAPAGRPRRLRVRPVHRGPRQLRHRRPSRSRPRSSRSRSAIGLVVPLLAALVPIARGVRITVREALASTGHQRPLRARAVRPLAARHPGPAAADAALDPQHVPAQGPAAP